MLQSFLISILDFFYPFVRRFLPLQTYRYAACGAGNTILGLFIYWLGLHYFHDQNVQVGFLVFKPHNASLFISSVFSVIVGFLLSKYIVFSGSYLKGHIQLFRYVLSFFMNLVINYFCLKLFVETMGIQEFTGQLISTCIVILFSYFSQKHFTFKEVG